MQKQCGQDATPFCKCGSLRASAVLGAMQSESARARDDAFGQRTLLHTSVFLLIAITTLPEAEIGRCRLARCAL